MIHLVILFRYNVFTNAILSIIYLILVYPVVDFVYILSKTSTKYKLLFIYCKDKNTPIEIFITNVFALLYCGIVGD